MAHNALDYLSPEERVLYDHWVESHVDIMLRNIAAYKKARQKILDTVESTITKGYFDIETTRIRVPFSARKYLVSMLFPIPTSSQLEEVLWYIAGVYDRPSMLDWYNHNIRALEFVVGTIRSKRNGDKEKHIDLSSAKDVSIERVLGIYDIPLVHNMCVCPFHPDSAPSLKIYPKNNSWYCFGCASGGSVVDFVMKKENVGFTEASRRLLSIT